MMKLKRWWKRVTCKHERIARFFPTGCLWRNRVSGMRGPHSTILVEGCLNCHKTWIKDYGE